MPKQKVLAVLLSAVLADVLAAPAAAYASAPNPGFFTALTVDRSNPNVVTFTLTADTAVGDCVALSGGTLQVLRPDASGLTYVVWHQFSYTHHTKHYDQWHTDITLMGSDGSSYLVPTSLDSAKMYTALQVYEWNQPSFIFPMTTALFEHITSVRWTVYC